MDCRHDPFKHKIPMFQFQKSTENWWSVVYLNFLQKLCSWVSMWTSSSLEGLSAGTSDRHLTAILIAISISSSSTSSPRILLSSTSRASPACCKCLSHCPKLTPLAGSPKNGSVGSLPVNKTPNIIPKLKTSLLSVYLFQTKISTIMHWYMFDTKQNNLKSQTQLQPEKWGHGKQQVLNPNCKISNIEGRM